VLVEIAERLDAWVVERNLDAQAAGMLRMPACTIRLLGQSALFEVGAPFSLAVTNDVVVRADYVSAIEGEFRRLLKLSGKELGPVGDEIWMPKETNYTQLFGGAFVTLEVADVGRKPEPPSRLKAFRMQSSDLALLTRLRDELGISETAVLRRGLRALATSLWLRDSAEPAP
jgi:hypothetical protein